MAIHPEDYHEFEADAYIIAEMMQDAGIDAEVEADGVTNPKILLPVVGRSKNYYFTISVGQNREGLVIYNIYWRMKGTKNRRKSVDSGTGPRSDGRELLKIVEKIYEGEY